MKKNLSYITVLLFVWFAYMLPANAANFDFKVQADSKEIVKGNETTVKVMIKSYETEGISTCSFKTDLGSGLELVSKNSVNNWNVTANSDVKYLLESNTEEGLTQSNSGDGVNILELKYKVNSNAKLTFSEIECSNGVGDFTHSDVSVDFTTKDVSADYTLKSLEITGGKIITEGGFTSINKSYVAEIDSNTFSIVATASNSDYQDKIKITNIEGGDPLNADNITFNPNGEYMVLLIAVNNATGDDVYNLMIKKAVNNADDEKKDNTLKSLTVGGKKVDLSSCKKEGNGYTCSVTLDSKVNSYLVNAVLNDATNFEFDEDNGGNGNYTGDSFLVIIKPKDKTLGIADLQYMVNVKMPGAGGSSSTPATPSKPSSSSNIMQNPQTGNIASFVMAMVLVFSLVASVLLYKKNMESYR